MIVKYHWRLVRPAKVLVRVNVLIVDEASYNVPINAGHFYMARAQWNEFMTWHTVAQTTMVTMGVQAASNTHMTHEFVNMDHQ